MVDIAPELESAGKKPVTKKERYEQDLRNFGELKETTGALNAIRWILGSPGIPMHIRGHLNSKADQLARFLGGVEKFDPKALEYDPSAFIVYDEKDNGAEEN